MRFLPPSELLRLGREENIWPTHSVAVDTETSGLFADDGARISTVSIAWWDDTNKVWDRDGVNFGFERVHAAEDDIDSWTQYAIVSLAWPFDQGIEGKPEDNGQGDLFGMATPNLPLSEFIALLQWLEEVGERVGLDMHNSKFDTEKFRVGCRRWPDVGVALQHLVRWDTQNGNDLLYPLLEDPATGRPTTSLKPSTSVLFDEDAADEQAIVKKYLKANKLPSGRWDLMPWDVIGSYADKDARLTARLKIRQAWDIDHGIAGTWIGDPEAVRQKLYRRLAITDILYEMERKGLPYDEVSSREAADLCRLRAKEIADRLPFKPTGPKAKQFFFGDIDKKTDKGVPCLGGVPYEVTAKGEPSLTAEVVGRMVDDQVPYAQAWADWNKVDNAASMWYEAYADAMGTDGRLRTNFRQNGTVSHRFSVGRVNLQAIPQDYRLTEFSSLEGIPTPRQLIGQAVTNMPGWSLYELDLAQAELRVAAMFAKCQRMLDMIIADEDLHTFTTLALFPHITQDDPLFKSQWRQVGKRGNFSLLFGAKGRTFQRMVSKETGIRLPDHEADRIVHDWNRLYPEFERAIDTHSWRVARRQAEHNRGWIDLLNGERRWFTRHEETHKAFNQRVQPNLAEFGMDWMLATHSYLESKGLGEENAGLLLTIHDSQVLLLPEEGGAEMAAQCAQFGKDLWKEWFPDVPGDVDYKAW